ncbi:uncharacterized protein MYCFIDRAFT_140513 [Pseudocercospora fijiensis CIRAD86]|uniref:BRCT domain-containing protein n=1 Tax=Pseudocercospora fijiensis (strain CIRAD86) TaxID=383855 RepID=M2ZQ43_PSEFD|nr:uncharacterized protein MYCFIDRAFT_140513 [Pseudocercospora fijiensis CIRAD86]EME81189.1 hypothetical protein MYCFIDRAFT_140513 [Pseudocercospora fijiensis CIRAD86]
MPYKAPTAAKPTKAIFDPFNSSATGHQRADNTLSGSTSWRDSRHKKLREQFSAGAGGGKRVSDTVGAGSLDFGKDDLLSPIDPLDSPQQTQAEDTKAELADEELGDDTETETSRSIPPQIFNNLCFYINGCTAPVSDHKLKHIISTHGGNMSIALGRRTVTHVILGKPNANGSGCGGGLAASKIHKEITQMRGKSAKFITADWVTESIKAGKRLPESRFEAMKLAPKGVANISTMFRPKEKA